MSRAQPQRHKHVIMDRTVTYIKTKRLSDKLDHIKLRPFKIKKVLEPILFKLELLISIRIHPVFYKSLLKLYENLNTILGLVEINKLT